MYLNFIDSIRNAFSNLIEKVNIGSLIAFLVGIVVGVIIVLMIYAVMLLKGVKNSAKKSASNTDNETEIKNEELVKQYIESSIDEYNEEHSDLGYGERFKLAKDICIQLALNIAKVYYPNSKHPLSELSIEELITLDYYIAKRVDKLFDGRVTKHLKGVKISTALKFYDAKKKADDNKLMKAAKKANVVGIGKAISNALNVINPVHWIKKGVTSITLNVGVDKIVEYIINIVGEEVAKVYSKNLFREETDFEKEINNQIENEKIEEKEIDNNGK